MLLLVYLFNIFLLLQDAIASFLVCTYSNFYKMLLLVSWFNVFQLLQDAIASFFV